MKLSSYMKLFDEETLEEKKLSDETFFFPLHQPNKIWIKFNFSQFCLQNSVLQNYLFQFQPFSCS